MPRLVGTLVVLCAVAIAPGVAAGYPYPGYVAGNTIVHDPSLLVRPEQPTYVVYATHNQTRVSADRITFAESGGPFVTKPAWWAAYNGNSGSMWAPDASYHDGRYWLYYSVSTVGSQKSAIGLATSPSGLPGTWTDSGGPILTTKPGDPYNAIDPNLIVDASGSWWLVFGSYWGGIYSTPVSKVTGKPASTTPAVTHLAGRNGGPIEGATMYRHGGYYYLFASFDRCCNGAASTYNIRVGRSTSPTGPFVDQQGRAMTDGGGTLVLASHDYVRGPGGQSVMWDPAWGGRHLLVYHYYDSRLTGQPFLGINFLGWTADGWPYVW